MIRPNYVNWNLDHTHAANLHINYKEAFTVILAAKRWAPLWLNKKIIIHTETVKLLYVTNQWGVGITCNTTPRTFNKGLFGSLSRGEHLLRGST